jgi:DNA-binding MarR family transcriptional regulator
MHDNLGRGADKTEETVMQRRARSTRRPPERTAPSGNGASRPMQMDALTGSVGYALRRAQLAAVADFLEALKDVDLRMGQFSVLMVIRDNPGIRQSEVCAALGIQKANFVPLFNELERRRLAVRRSGVADRRAYALHLTREGEQLLQRACELHDIHEQRMVQRLGRGGRARLLALLAKLADGA